ncbi:MAG: SDR family NAD(P)-dependent oxidoreductase, partial [Acidobacteria bacterium]|nr:SDR family NAD(P)-dependent oxidoreductase [Acidobacteriota bacterium]
MDIQGSSAIVTGGASGLGAATVRRLSAAGMQVAIIDMQDEFGETVAEEVGGVFVHADVTDADEVQSAIDIAVAMGDLRVLVNCAGIGAVARTVNRDGTPHDLGYFRKVIAINLVGTFNCIRLAAVAMARNEPAADNERGAIGNTASVAAYDGPIGQAAYSAPK